MIASRQPFLADGHHKIRQQLQKLRDRNLLLHIAVIAGVCRNTILGDGGKRFNRASCHYRILDFRKINIEDNPKRPNKVPEGSGTGST